MSRRFDFGSWIVQMNSPSKHSRTSRHRQLSGMYWATRVTSIGMQMAILPGLGYLADRRFGTLPWLTIVGACLGFLLAMMDVFRLAREAAGRPVREQRGRPHENDVHSNTQP